MGRIKSTLIKRTARKLIENIPELFNSDFKHNEKVLGNTMPSKPIRNKIAGYIARLLKTKKPTQEKDPVIAE